MYFKKSHQNSEVVSIAKSSIIKGSVQKVNMVLKLLRGKPVSEALLIINRVQKQVADDIRKTLLAAISNAENKGSLDIDNLVLKHISAGKSYKLRRFQPRARGRIFSVNKHYSKIYIELHELVEE